MFTAVVSSAALLMYLVLLAMQNYMYTMAEVPLEITFLKVDWLLIIHIFMLVLVDTLQTTLCGMAATCMFLAVEWATATPSSLTVAFM
jgi:hypothetical protein